MAIRAISSRPKAEMHQAIPERSISWPTSSSSGTSAASCSRLRAAYRLVTPPPRRDALPRAPDLLLHRRVACGLELDHLLVAEGQYVGLVGRVPLRRDRGEDHDHVLVGEKTLRRRREALLGQLHPEADHLVLPPVGAADRAVAWHDPLDAVVEIGAGAVDVGRRERGVRRLGRVDVLLCTHRPPPLVVGLCTSTQPTERSSVQYCARRAFLS